MDLQGKKISLNFSKTPPQVVESNNQITTQLSLLQAKHSFHSISSYIFACSSSVTVLASFLGLFSSFQSLSSTKKPKTGQTIQMQLMRAKQWEIIPSFDLQQPFCGSLYFLDGCKQMSYTCTDLGMGQTLFTVIERINLEWVHLSAG